MPERVEAATTARESAQPTAANPVPHSAMPRIAGWAILALIPAAAVVVFTTLAMGRTGYDELDRGFPGMFTALLSASLWFVVEVASIVCLGALFYALFLRARKAQSATVVDNASDLRAVRWSALVWMCGAAALVVVDAADSNGVSLDYMLKPGAFGYLIQASYLPGAWLLVLVVAAIIFAASNFIRTWQSTLLLLGCGIVGVLAPVLVTQVLVGPNHDFGGDAAIFGVPAAAVWFGAAAVLAARVNGAPKPSAVTIRRFMRLSVVCWSVVVATQVIIAVVELAGSSLFASATGGFFAAQFALLALAAVLGVLGWRSYRAAGGGASAVPRGILYSLLCMMALYVGVGVAMTRVPPPVYFVPTSVMQLFFGYDVTTAPTLAVLVFDWRVNILFLVIAVVASLVYLLGYRTVRARNEPWPIGRLISWLLGWLVIVIATSSGLGKYSGASFSLHMILHMSINMLGPLLLVLGGPLTLALQAAKPRGPEQPAGLHEWIRAWMNWPLSRRLHNPIIIFAVFVGSYFLLYFTGLFGEASRYHWAHQLMNLEFILAGYAFYKIVIGVDPSPYKLPSIGKLGFILAAMPFHAFFGVIVLTSDTIIAETFYRYVNAPWMTDLKEDQFLAGGIAWAAAELPLIIVVLALVTQWTRQDQREAVHADKQMDAGVDDSFEAYNSMLASFAEREDPTPPHLPHTHRSSANASTARPEAGE